jgi:hypothetical protein
MVVQQEVSPPMSVHEVSLKENRSRSPIWQHLYDCLESRSDLGAEDQQLKQCLAALLATSSSIEQQRLENWFFRSIAGDKLQFLHYWIRQWGIQDGSTIEDLVQDSCLYFLQITLPKFSPTGTSVVGCCRTYFRFAVQATVSNYFRKQKPGQLSSLDEQSDWQKFAERPQASGLRGILAAELEDTENRWLELVEQGSSELLDFSHANCPACTVRDVLWRRGFKQPPDTHEDVAKAYGMDLHNTYYPFYKRHVVPRAQALLLEPNLLTDEQAAMVRAEIDRDTDRVLQTPINTKMPQVTVQFVAQQHLWLYADRAMDFAAIAQLARERFGYKKLTAEMLADFWWRKCQKALAKMVGVVFG